MTTASRTFWLSAAAAIALPALAAQAQTPPAAPPAEEVLLEADSVRRDPDADQVIAEGRAEARYQGRTLKADKILYDLKTRRVTATGSVVLTDEDGTVVFAERVEADQALDAGVIANFSMRLENDATVAAAGAVREGARRNSLFKAVYTACPVCPTKTSQPSWTLRARTAVQNVDRRMITYRDATITAEGVPILYLPYFAHPDPTADRQSGFLAPTPGYSRRLGAFWEQPYYWAISPSQDVTISALASTKVRPLLEVDYRKRFWSGELRVRTSGTKERLFTAREGKFGEDTWRSHVFAEGRFEISDYWDWGFGAERVSDDLYLRRYNREGEGAQRGVFRAQPERLLTQAYLVGQDADSYVRLSGVLFQGLRPFDDDKRFPRVGPLVEARRTFAFGPLSGRTELLASGVALNREIGADSARATAQALWRGRALLGPGVLVEPFALARADTFRFRDLPGRAGDTTVTRTVGLAGAEARWPLVRPGRITMIVEPRVTAAASAGDARNGDVVLEDAQGFELDESALLRPNGASNYDYWETGGRVAAMVRATGRWGDGREAYVGVGRRWRQEADPAFSRLSNLRSATSDVVAEAGLDLGPQFGATARLRLGEDDLKPLRVDATARARLWRLDLRARYYTLDRSVTPGARADSEEIEGYASLAINRRLKLYYATRYDLANSLGLSAEAGLSYGDACTQLNVFWTRTETQNRFIGPNDEVRVQVTLFTLGGVAGD